MKTPHILSHFAALLLCLLTVSSLLPLQAQSSSQSWTLRQCIDYALEHNLTVRQQQLSVSNSRLALSTARAQRLPSLSAGVSQNFSFGRGLTMDNTYTNTNTQSTSFSLGTDLPLLDGGSLDGTVTARRIDLQAALADLDKAREDVSLQVTSAYLDALLQQELVGVNERQLSLSQKQFQRLDLLLRNGKTSRAEWAEAQSTVANDQLSLTQQINSRDLALLTLSQLLELPTPEGFSVSTADTAQLLSAQATLPSPDLVFAEAEGQRPQILADQYRLQSATQEVKVARSGLFPSLSFSAGLGSSYYKTSRVPAEKFSRQLDNNFNQYIGLNLSIPIFSRLQVRNSIRQAKLQAENQRITLETTRQSLYKEIQQAYYNARAAQSQCAASQTALDAAQAAFLLMQKKYENGKATATEYEEQKTRYSRAEADLLQARYTALFRLKILDFYRGIPLA